MVPGTLLVSSVELIEPTFRRTVVYLVEHSPGGSLGVVLNRPSETAVHDVLPAWASYTARPQALFVGGPVKRDSALCMGTLRAPLAANPRALDGVRGLRRVQGRVVMVDLDADPSEVVSLLDGVRVFVGYSGWSPGQLAGELARNDWMTLSALPADVLAAGRVDLWGRVLRRQPMPLALLATHPLDASRN